MSKHHAVTVLTVLATAARAVNYPAIPGDRSTPVQQRIAVNAPGAISVGWNTFEPVASPCVAYGTAPDRLDLRACGSSVTYASSRTYSNAAVLTSLAPATTYYYKIDSTNSTVEHFLSPRVPGDPTPFQMNVVIDLGVYGEDGFTIEMDMSKRDTIPFIDPSLNHTTIRRLADTVDDYELIIHPGDLGYADDWIYNAENLLDSRNAYEAILETFYGQLAPVAARKPYQASPGNHEATCQEVPYTWWLCPDGQRNFTDFMHRFGRTMPSAFASTSRNATAQVLANTAKQLANPPFWYSFEYGMAHVVMIDTETDFANAPDTKTGKAHLGAGPFGRDGQQLAFLEADLASVDRAVTPWVIVGGHRPWYSTGGDKNHCTACQDAFEPLLYRYGVDVGVFGHVHNAQRFLPVNNSIADPNGMHNPKAPMYIVAGGPGNVEGLSPVGDNHTTNVFAYADDFSYASITFQDRQHLKVDFYHSATGALLDSSVLYKEHNDRFVLQA